MMINEFFGIVICEAILFAMGLITVLIIDSKKNWKEINERIKKNERNIGKRD